MSNIDIQTPQPLLAQAKKLADTLKFAFNTPSGVPYNDLVIPSQAIDATTNGLATVGTLVLEWTRLSDLTGNPEYAKLAHKAESYLLNPVPAKNEPFPGLIGSDIFLSNGNIANNASSWSGGDDSFYEYLIKMWVYDPRRFGKYGERFTLAAESAMKYLRSEPQKGTVFLTQFNGRNTYNVSQHLTCFDGGTFILAGLTQKRQDFVNFGLQLAEGCHNTYAATVTGIGPDSFGWDKNSVPKGQEQFFQKNGWYPMNSNYYLRPEVLESIYYAYRATGDPKYQEWSWAAFKAINATCRTTTGFTEVSDVNALGGGQKRDNQESFFFAEVLKYSYLIQAAVS
jgi:mannosyl-oligosaccharide alpha-1,2-mannosidase